MTAPEQLEENPYEAGAPPPSARRATLPSRGQMRDLLTARATAALAPLPHRRAVTALVVAVAAIWVAATAGVAVSHGSNSAPGQALARSDAQPGSAVALAAIKAPAGSVAVDFGLLRFYVPGALLRNATCGGPGGASSPANGWCFDTPNGGFMSVEPYGTAVPDELPGSVINGVAVKMVDNAGVKAAPVTLFVPSVQLQITGQGPARAVVDTLGRSALQAVLEMKAPVAPPRDWKWHTSGGISVKVPRGWPVRLLGAGAPSPRGCGTSVFSTPTLFEVAAPVPTCPNGIDVKPTAAVDGVWIDSGPTIPGDTIATGLPFFGPDESLIYNPLSPVPAVEVQVVRGSRKVNVLVGLGPDPRVAEEIISSLRASS